MRRPDLESEGTLSRRRVLLSGSSAGLVMASSLTGCDLLSTSPSDGSEDGSANRERVGLEAPELAEMVEAGDLPPLETRLPTNPLVLEPVDRQGVYGGTWNAIIQSASDTGWIHATAGYDQLLRWDPEFREPLPNIAESFDVDDEAREYVFHLREGLRWSDGEPFTADDVMFAYEDVLTNQDLYPSPPTFLTPGGEPAEVERLDGHTVVFRFAVPHALFPMRLASSSGEVLTMWPKHYLTEFHQDYGANVVERAEQEGFAEWNELFLAKAERWVNPDLPTLAGWRGSDESSGGDRIVVERNPYYWKVDTEGSQLPYIDQISYRILEDEQVILLAVSQGDIHFDMWRVGTPQNKPILARNRESGGYRFFDCVWGFMNNMMISFNLCHKDERKRDLFRSLDFRIGASFAINREELISGVLQGQGEPWQGAPRPESEFYDEELAKQYTEYDVDRANDHLDRAGLDERDDEGYRLGPDGRRVSFSLLVPSSGGDPTFVPVSELLISYWKEVGLDARMESVGISLFTSRQEANEFDVNVWQGEWGLNDAVLSPHWYMPSDGFSSRFASLWGSWYETGGASGEEPPDAAKQQMQLYDDLKETTDADERRRIFMEILRIARDQFYCIGTSLAPATFGVARNDFHNVPDTIYRVYPNPGFTNPQQYFIEA